MRVKGKKFPSPVGEPSQNALWKSLLVLFFLLFLYRSLWTLNAISCFCPCVRTLIFVFAVTGPFCFYFIDFHGGPSISHPQWSKSDQWERDYSNYLLLREGGSRKKLTKQPGNAFKFFNKVPLFFLNEKFSTRVINSQAHVNVIRTEIYSIHVWPEWIHSLKFVIFHFEN